MPVKSNYSHWEHTSCISIFPIIRKHFLFAQVVLDSIKVMLFIWKPSSVIFVGLPSVLCSCTLNFPRTDPNHLFGFTNDLKKLDLTLCKNYLVSEIVEHFNQKEFLNLKDSDNDVWTLPFNFLLKRCSFEAWEYINMCILAHLLV